MEQKDKEKDNKPIIPTLKDSMKPQLKIKGLSQGGLSLMERLKQFKKKDLAFIMAGLGVLFMAPLAEHFMMAPENGDGQLGPGTSNNGTFKVGSPYDPGINGYGSGNPVGANGDVITPLNVRDPSALIMGPSSSVQPPAGSPATTTPAKDSGDWKDALTQSAATAGKKAVKAAGLPIPKSTLSGGGLRGMGALGGGGGGAGGGGGGDVSSKGLLGNRPVQDSLKLSRASEGYRGVGARGSDVGTSGSFDALKKAAENAANPFNRTGGDSGGGSSGGVGGGEKSPGGNNLKDSKSLGESLAFLKLKAEQDHAIDLEWKLKEEAAMRWPKLETKMLEEAVMSTEKAFTGLTGDFVKNALKSGGSSLACGYKNADGALVTFTLGKDDIADGISGCAPTSGGSEAGKSGKDYYHGVGGEGVFQCGTNTPITCDSKPSKDPGDKHNTEDALNRTAAPGNTPGGAASVVSSLNDTCGKLGTDVAARASKVSGGASGVSGSGAMASDQATAADHYENAAQNVIDASWALTGRNSDNPAKCGQANPDKIVVGGGASDSVYSLLMDVKKEIAGDGSGSDGKSLLARLGTTNAAIVSVLNAAGQDKNLKDALPKADAAFYTAYNLYGNAQQATDLDAAKNSVPKDAADQIGVLADAASKTTGDNKDALDKSNPGADKEAGKLVSRIQDEFKWVDNALGAVDQKLQAADLSGDSSADKIKDPTQKQNYKNYLDNINKQKDAVSNSEKNLRAAEQAERDVFKTLTTESSVKQLQAAQGQQSDQQGFAPPATSAGLLGQDTQLASLTRKAVDPKLAGDASASQDKTNLAYLKTNSQGLTTSKYDSASASSPDTKSGLPASGDVPAGSDVPTTGKSAQNVLAAFNPTPDQGPALVLEKRFTNISQDAGNLDKAISTNKTAMQNKDIVNMENMASAAPSKASK